MNTFMATAKRFLKSEDGPTATEYAVMLALIIVALVGVIGTLKDGISGTFSGVATTLTGGS